MNSRTIERVTLSAPTDQSLRAYKAWVRDIAARLTTPESALTFTETEWVTFWKEFWEENYGIRTTARMRSE